MVIKYRVHLFYCTIKKIWIRMFLFFIYKNKNIFVVARNYMSYTVFVYKLVSYRVIQGWNKNKLKHLYNF